MPDRLKREYLYITIASLGLWLSLSGLTAARYIARPKMRQHRAESILRSGMHFLCTWFVLAFNFPWRLIEIVNPYHVLKIFLVRDKGSGTEHFGMVYATNELTDWKGTGRLANLFQIPSLIFGDPPAPHPPNPKRNLNHS